MAQPAPDAAAVARKALDQLLAGQYQDLFQTFSPEVQKAIPEATLPKVGVQIKTWGAVERIGDPTVRPGPNKVAVIQVKFATQTIDFQFAINTSGQVAGLFMRPAGQIPWQRPAYSKPDAFHAREVTVGDDEWKLPGTLTLPNGGGPFPGIVLVQGSGPNDRDETVGGSKVFRDLAEGLSSRGIAVLRYEKRTREYPTRMAGNKDLTVEEETVEDAVRAAALLRAQSEVDPKRIYVLGHSLGGYVSPRIAEQDGKLAGLVVMAGNARPLEDLIVDQAEYLGESGPNLQNIRAMAARVKKLEPEDSDAPPLMGMPVSYLLDLKGYDPAAQAKDLKIRMLILQGERDFQVNMKDLALWKAALGDRKDVTFHTYPALNHLFIAGEGRSTEAEYAKPGHVAPEVIDDIAKWLTETR